MGWNTKVVGVADQDKIPLTRWVVNRQPSVPFVEGNCCPTRAQHGAMAARDPLPGISPDALRVIATRDFRRRGLDQLGAWLRLDRTCRR